MSLARAGSRLPPCSTWRGESCSGLGARRDSSRGDLARPSTAVTFLSSDLSRLRLFSFTGAWRRPLVWPVSPAVEEVGRSLRLTSRAQL